MHHLNNNTPMGNSNTAQIIREEPSPNHDATLYYFGGRGRADQV